MSDEIVVWKDDKKTTKVTVCIEENREVEFPDKIAIDFIWDKKNLLDWLSVWDVATFYFWLSYNRWKWEDGNWEERIYNSVKWWRVDNIEKALKKEEDSDLPFKV